MNFFQKEPTAAEAAKTTKKQVRSSQRDIDKEIRDLEKSEKQVLADIKKRAKVSGGKDDKILRTLASQLVQIRAQKDKMMVAKSHVASMVSAHWQSVLGPGYGSVFLSYQERDWGFGD